MAKLVAYTSYDMPASRTLDGFPLFGSSTMSVSSGSSTEIFRGSFHRDIFETIGGTLKSYTFLTNGVERFEFSSLNKSMYTILLMRSYDNLYQMHSYMLSGPDRLIGSPYADVLVAFGGQDLVLGNGGDDALYGGLRNDHLRGGDGRDLLDGEEGADLMVGGTGNDTYFVDVSSDRVVENVAEGSDYVHSSASFVLPANVEHLRLIGEADVSAIGNALANRIDGNAGDNLLRGDAGNDNIFGWAGSDRIEAGTGRDLIRGGADRDIFLFRAIEEAGIGRGRDVVHDFQQGLDLIHLAAIDADVAAAGNQAFVWIATGPFTGAAGELRQTGQVVEGDVDGNGVADFQLAVPGHAALQAGDFLL